MYNRTVDNGLEIFLHRNLVQSGPEVVLGLGGFWIFRWPTVKGLAPLAACAIG